MNTKTERRMIGWGALALLVLAAGCSDGEPTSTAPGLVGPGIDTVVDPKEPELGQSDFISADGRNGDATQEGGERGDDEAAPNADADVGDGGDDRSVEEGDIYRVLGDQRILNLNAYRGLQIINVEDMENPAVEGRMQVTGYPVELYVLGDKAVVLMNNWRGYWRSVHDTRPETFQGGLVMVVDISDRANPRVTGKARVPGWIQTSRLTRSSDAQALYVASSYWGERINDQGETESGTYTYVKSFEITSRGAVAERSEINLGGYVGDIQATTERLMVSRVDWSGQEPRSSVSLIDISNPDGTMIEGAEVQVRGYVANKYNMDVHGDVLRIVSGSAWGGTRTNHVQTYDASDIQQLDEIDHETFGDGENLFATLFLGEKAFFVTYRQVDPFHAFEIDRDGQIHARSEYIISGWNNYLRPVMGGDRLIGIGVNDEDGQTMAVSLYDTTDLSNPNPFLGRAEVETEYSWSEAQWDDRAFSVLEDATEAVGANGERETGMVLLPFSGWDRDTQEYFAAVQIFTFSDRSLTQRGIMHHGSPVRRSFQADGQHTANLSEAELSLFDTQNPDAPAELGRVELAPNFTDFLVFGDHGVRVRSHDYYSLWTRDMTDEPRLDKLEIIRLGGDPDMAEAVATLEVPTGARLQKVGDLLVATHMAHVPNSDPALYDTTIQAFDLSRPERPVARGQISTQALQPSYYGYYFGEGDCFDCWYGGYSLSPDAHAVSQAVVFSAQVQEQRLLGNEEICQAWPVDNAYDYNRCWTNMGEPRACTYVTGSRVCRSLNGAEPHCTGSFYRCEQDSEGQSECEPIAEERVRLNENCYEHELYRYWQHYRLHVLDLSDADAPALSEAINLPSREESSGIVVEGDALYISHRVPTQVQDDPRPFVRYFVRRLDMADPAAPELGEPVNVPGELLDVTDEGRVLITQDFVWGEEIIEAAINRLTVREGRAFLDARRRFVDAQIHGVAIDERGNLVVNHQLAWRAWQDNTPQENLMKMTILDVTSPALPVRSEVDVDVWAQLREVRQGRALYAVPEGLLVMNLDDPSAPFAQSYFPVRGWPEGITVDRDDIYFAAGRFGLYRFDMGESNIDEIF